MRPGITLDDVANDALIDLKHGRIEGSAILEI